MTCFYSLSEENAQLKEENERLRKELAGAEVGEAASEADYQEQREENERLREFVEFVASLTVSLPPGVDQEKFSNMLVNVLKADALKALGERD